MSIEKHDDRFHLRQWESEMTETRNLRGVRAYLDDMVAATIEEIYLNHQSGRPLRYCVTVNPDTGALVIIVPIEAMEDSE